MRIGIGSYLHCSVHVRYDSMAAELRIPEGTREFAPSF